MKQLVTMPLKKILLEFSGANNNTVKSLINSQRSRGGIGGTKQSASMVHERRMYRQGRGTPNTDISGGVKNKVVLQNIKNEGKVEAQVQSAIAKEETKHQLKQQQ